MRLRLYVDSARDHLRDGGLRRLLRMAADRVYSNQTSVVVRMDLTEDSGTRRSAAHSQIKAASLTDVLDLVAVDDAKGIDAEELWDRRLRRHFAATLGVEGCYVADVADTGPAFMLYLFTADDNRKLQTYFRGAYPVLDSDEALLEHLYVAPESRNPGLIVGCLSQVADEARRRGASSASSLIEPTNKGALFVNHLVGFKAHGVRRCRRRFARRTYTWEPWPAGVSQSLMDLASGRTRIA